MQMVSSAAAAIGRATFGVLALGSMIQPLRPTPGEVEVAQQATFVSSAATTTMAATPDWHFEIDEATLGTHLNAWSTSQAALDTPLGTARLEGLSVQLHDQVMLVRGTARTNWFATPLELAASASVQQGRAVLQLRNAQLHGIRAPDVARGELERYLQDQVDASLASHHLTVSSVSIHGGKLTLSGSLT
jgi:hypothetical protein